jgi:hypothetical protein
MTVTPAFEGGLIRRSGLAGMQAHEPAGGFPYDGGV